MKIVLNTNKRVRIEKGNIKAVLGKHGRVRLNGITGSVAGTVFRILEDEDFRITEGGDFRILE